MSKSTLRYLAAHRCSKLDIHEALQGSEDDIERKVNVQIVFANPEFFLSRWRPLRRSTVEDQRERRGNVARSSKVRFSFDSFLFLFTFLINQDV